MGSRSLEEKKWELVTFAHALVRPISTITILFGLVALTGYLLNIEMLYRPIAHGAATNPLTASCIILLGFVIRSNQNQSNDGSIVKILAFLVIVATSSRIFDSFFDTDISTLITPFQSQVEYQLEMGKDNSMGFNSALMLFFIAIALSLYSFHRLIASQFVAFISLGIPTVAFTGYAYGLEHFYGQMSLLTATTGVTLALASLAKTAQAGPLKAILSPYIGGAIARAQIISGYIIPTILGYMVINSLADDRGEVFGLYVVVLCWFIILMVSIAAVFQEDIDNKRRDGERLLAHAAMHDQLTELPNRRKFLEYGQHEIDRAKRTGKPIWLLILDIDKFKSINDTAGHGMGDQVLVTIGKNLKHMIRSDDLVSRFGGEEFAVILTNTTRQGAERVAENIRANIESIKIEGWTDIYGSVSVSIGCATTDGTHTLEETLKAADGELYKAKHNGRNQVSFIE